MSRNHREETVDRDSWNTPHAVWVDLQDPFELHGGRVLKFHVRPPTPSEYFQLGDPFTIARTGDGNDVMVEDRQVIVNYLEKCTVPRQQYFMFETEGSLRDAIALKNVMLSFFLPGGAANQAESVPSSSTSSAATLEASPIAT